MSVETIVNSVRGWLGIGPEYAITRVYLRSALPPVLLVAFVALAAVFAWYLYRRESALSRWTRAYLGVLRLVILGLILLILFEPAIGLEKQVTVRRNLLVLLDRSESMTIKDARGRPEELADAALALGKVRFVLPEQQEALSRMERAMRGGIEALKGLRFHDALESIRAAEEAIAPVLKDKGADTRKDPDAAKKAEVARPILDAIRGIASQQTGVRRRAEELEKEGSRNEERCKTVLGIQESALRDLEKIITSISQVSIPLPAGAGSESSFVPRMAMAQGLLKDPELHILEKANKAFKVRYFSFAERIEPAGGEGETEAKALAAVEATGKSTRLASAIEDALTRYSGQSIAGLVLLSDGAANGEGADPQGVAKDMKEKGVPLYVVGLGLEAPKDVGVRSLIVQDAVFPKDKVPVRVEVFSRGFKGVKTDIQLLLDGVEMAKQPVELSDEPKFIEMSFQVPEGKGALAKLRVEIPSQPGEISSSNNRAEQPIKIINQKIKVLYVEGKPRWEYRYLRVVLLRDPRLDVRFLMTLGDADLPKASPQYLPHYPEKAEDAFAFDLVILGDVPAWYFTRPQLERMVELVQKRGGSLLMLVGDRYAPGSYVETPIAEVLPVKITREHVDVPPAAYPSATADGRRTFAMLESNEKANEAVWSLARPLHRVPRLDGAKAGASVILQLPATATGSTDPYPLIAWQRAGTGKVMYVGTDQLWRLRFMRGDHYHAAFWGQAIQFLTLSRLLGENSRISLKTDRVQLQVGEKLQIHANVLDETYQPAKVKEYTVRLEPDGKSQAKPVTLKLTPVPQAPGLYSGSCTVEHYGRYTLKTLPEDSRFSNTVDLIVEPVDLEQQEPAMQEATLRKMADLSGGRFLTVREWPALAGLLEGQERTVKESKDMDLWDIWPLYALLVLCAGAEWFFRRRNHLV